MRPNHGHGENLKRGLKAEDAFLELARKQGFQVHHASEAADIHEHWDCWLTKGNESLLIEFVQKNVDRAVQVTPPTEALKKHQGKYPVYRRRGRSDASSWSKLLF
ncbi:MULTISPECIES: hypothetical protein [unclassified Thermosynechococcus]|uniref:hypothetical protein n=1 Tax=unclassified Thermosynechococcus TaxID=2622553 RepID=UPI0019DBD4FC|nr:MULTISPECIES: hypothetical protein [unclassified Thermosynechococcus]HIK35132.1 hypothetical protein [Thermosynechococcus sp. M98_K2018_005]HIK49215.1 hypothetical protein [Thermosynechococcus sp. M55_K2018_012]